MNSNQLETQFKQNILLAWQRQAKTVTLEILYLPYQDFIYHLRPSYHAFHFRQKDSTNIPGEVSTEVN